jgi:hypothetical protein
LIQSPLIGGKGEKGGKNSGAEGAGEFGVGERAVEGAAALGVLEVPTGDRKSFV